MPRTAPSRADGFAVLHLEGALRAPVSIALRTQVQDLLGGGERRILLNLSGVLDLDAAGLGELVRVHNLALTADAVLRISGAAGRTRELLVRVGLLDLLNLEATPVSKPSPGLQAFPPAKNGHSESDVAWGASVLTPRRQ